MPRVPLPRVLQPRPKRPGDGNGNGKAEPPPPVEAGLTVVDWVDERTSLSPTVRWLLFRKVPRGTNWA
ncbi:MAG TPA: cytochrome B6, partial [Solirubrobacteraceae bacterium]